MKKSLFWLLLIFTFPISVFAQTGTIEGTVYNQNTGRPLANAEVHILETDEREKSDAEGNVWFTGVPRGTYTLTITHPSFTTPTTTSVEVT
ncbi:MAG: carboxypeptidase-like regulatory domain-containing protein, partial [Candidatus Poribacteria bacterium]|nr:carboxypeptidase-like regulatory domain-containing protein [Candidatus Poribacteria bacterium]